MCLFIELGRHVYHGERMNSIYFGCYRSKVKVTMCIINKCGVCGDATLCVVIYIFCSRAFFGSHKLSFEGDIFISGMLPFWF